MRRCSFSTVAYYRPTTACPSHQSHSRSIWPVQLPFFICGRRNPATDIEGRGRERERIFGVPPSMCPKWLIQHAACTHTQYIVRIYAPAHKQCTRRQRSVHCAVRVHREAYTVSQSTSPSDTFPWTGRWGFTTTSCSSVKNRRAAPEVPSRIFAQSLRLNPHCMSRSKVSAQPFPPCKPDTPSHLLPRMGSGTAQQPTSSLTPPRMVKDSIRACGTGQGAVSILRLQLVGSHLILRCP